MKNLLFLLTFVLTGCACLYPQTRPRCPSVCDHAVELKCPGVFTTAAAGEIDPSLCALVCKDRYGISRGMEVKRCITDADTCEEIAVCIKKFGKQKKEPVNLRDDI